MHGIHEFVSNQEETDAQFVLYPLGSAVKLGYKPAVVRTPDSDIFFILLPYAHSIPLTIYLDTGSRKHRQILNVTELSESKGANYCTTMLALYVFTGKDGISALRAKVKCDSWKSCKTILGAMLRLDESVLYMTVSA